MFFEPFSTLGHIEVISGCMFSGKTEELIRRLKRAVIAKQNVGIFKPKIDTRYSNSHIFSHNSTSLQAIEINQPSEILNYSSAFDVIGIDEVQFFEESIIDIVHQLANQGKRVIIAGLDLDYKGKPFKNIPSLLALAEYVTKVHAICVKCGQVAHYSHRTNKNEEMVFLGESDSYEALCRPCYFKII